MNEHPELKAGEAIATAQVQIIRAKTGKVENYTIEFRPLEEQPEEPKKDE